MDTSLSVPEDTKTALDLGFHLCGEAEKTTNKQKYGSLIEEVQLKSIQNLVVLTEELAMRGVEPGASLKTVLDIAEFNFKASGMAAKQVKDISPSGGGYQLFINFSGNTKKESFSGVTIEQVPVQSPAAQALPTIDVVPNADV